MWTYAKALLFLFLIVLSSGSTGRAYAANCSSYSPNSESYFNCLLSSDTASFHDNCKKVTDPRFPNTQVTKLMSHDGVSGNEQRFVYLVKDGTSLICPSGDPSDAPNWTAGGVYDKKIAISYAPCNGNVAAVSDSDANPFLDRLDCSPTGKASGEVDDLNSNSSRKSPVTLALGNGDCQKAYNVTFCAEVHSPYICAYVPNGLDKIYIGCYEPASPLATSQPAPPPSLPCFIPSLCWDKNALSGVSKNPINFSISGVVAMCAEGAIDKIFFSGWDSTVATRMANYGTFGQTGEMGSDTASLYSCPTVSMFDKVQQSLRAAATAAITLWVVLWGVRVTISGAPPSRGEFIKNLVTVSIVMYFSLGAGWTEYLPILKQLMVGLSSAMMNAVSGNDPGTLCVHTASEYPAGFETMALWDTFDCKIVTYFFSNQAFPKLLEVAFLSIFTAGIYGVLILLLCLVFAFFLIGLLIYATEIYIVSLVIIALLVFISPIFIPMVLFNATKGYFKAWLGELISVSLYPVIMFGFIALMLAVFDRFYFGDCQAPGVTCSPVYYTLVNSYTVEVDPSSAGAQLHAADTDWDNMNVNGINFDLFLIDLLKICFFAYLFFTFMTILGPFISELVGSAKTDLSGISSGAGQKVMGKGAGLAKKSAEVAAGALKGAAKGGKAGAIKGAAEAAVKSEMKDNNKDDNKGAARVDTTSKN